MPRARASGPGPGKTPAAGTVTPGPARGDTPRCICSPDHTGEDIDIRPGCPVHDAPGAD